MNRCRPIHLVLAILVVALLGFPVTVASAQSGLDEVRELGETYRDPAVAVGAGFVRTDECVELPGTGGMGYHYVHPTNIADGVLDPVKPDVLVYVPTRAGRHRLGAVEYLQFDADQDLATDDDRPSMFGQAFDGPMPGHEPGMPIHYDLHVWVGKSNPDGLLTAWNPRVQCPEPFDWSDIVAHRYDGFRVGPCGGEAPVACVRKDGKRRGSVEHFTAPVSDFDYLDGVTGERRAIRLVARDFLREFRKDRTTGCSDHTFHPIRPERVTVAGSDGLRWGFTLRQDGEVTERTLVYGVVQDDELHLIAADAGNSRACVPSEGQFTVRWLKRFREAFRVLAHDSDFS